VAITEPFDLDQMQVADQAGPVRRTGDVRIVHDHGDVVGGHPHVELDHVGAVRDGRLERGDRVLGLARRRAAMCHDQPQGHRRIVLLTESPFRHYARLGPCLPLSASA
jgi:hypothetical protein